MSFLSLQDRATLLSFSHALRAMYILGSPHSPMMSSAMVQGMQMNGDVPSICGKVRPMSPLVLSLVQSSLTLMECHWIPLCGRIGGVLLLPPSKTITSLLILLVVILSWVIGTTTSLRTRSCFLSYFLAQRRQRWKTMGDGTSAAAAAAHCVQSEEFSVVLEKTWTQEGGLEDLNKGNGWLFSLVSVICTLVWQLDPDDTVNWVKGPQWTLLLLSTTKDRPGREGSTQLLVILIRLPW